MSTGYRQNARSHEDLVLGERKGVVLWQIVLALLLGVVVVAMLSHRVRLDCERASNVCTITDQRISWSKQSTLALDTLRGAEAVKDDDVFRVVLTTTAGPVMLSGTGESGGETQKRDVADAIATFARSDAPTLHVGYGSLASAWPFGLVALFLLLLSGPLFRVRVLAESTGSLRVERSLLGIWSRARHYALDGVRSAKVVFELPKEIDGPSFFTSSDNWFVLLERTRGVVLLDDWNTRKSAPSESLCTAIREHLATLG